MGLKRGNVIKTAFETYVVERQVGSVNFVKGYLPLANEDYVSRIKREHIAEIDRRKNLLRSEVAQEEARQRTLERVSI